MSMYFNFLRNWNYTHKMNSRNSTLIIHTKVYMQAFASIVYHMYNLCRIIYESILLQQEHSVKYNQYQA